MVRGVVVAYDGSRGFGFIRSPEFREDVFVHRNAVDGKGPLRTGQRVEFVAEPSDRGMRATRVVPGRLGLSPALAGTLLLIAVLVAVTLALHRVGLGWVGAYLGGMGVATWLAFARDKRNAGLGERRVPEAVLLGLSLLGGSPAGLMAMLALRHKMRKPSFLIPFGLIVTTQVMAVLAWMKWRSG
jgi:uncharacterized membrane protein YsdA (DUF1294 family)/cold shock CspA family protein